MKKAVILTAAVLIASPAFAQTTTGTSSQGATKYAPGQQMHNTKKPSTGPGASEYAPGHQKDMAGPGHSESAPGQRMKHPTTTGSNTGMKNSTTTGSNTGRR